jgi:hypothetical protein
MTIPLNADLAPGRIAFAPGTGTLLIVAGQVTAIPFQLPVSINIDAIGVAVTTAGSADAAVEVVLAEDGPGSAFGPIVGRVILPAGQLNTVGNRLVAVPNTALRAAVYWGFVRLIAGTTAPTLRAADARARTPLDTLPAASAANTQPRAFRWTAAAIPDDLNTLGTPTFADNAQNPTVLIRTVGQAQNGVIAPAQSAPVLTGARWALPTAIGGKPVRN